MKWTREHEIITLDLYCRIPFNKANNSNKEIQSIAELLGRTVNSVKMKIGNFGSFDPELRRLGIVGLDGTSQLDTEIWNEYYGHWDKLAYDAKVILSNYSSKTIEEVSNIDLGSFPEGKSRETIVRQRVNQNFFRNAVLSSYSMQCCITGIRGQHLLEAAHIVPWVEDETNRTNPCNGLCINALVHNAYDCFLISVSPDYEICVSEELIADEKANPRQINFFQRVNGKKIIKPNRFLPDSDLLAQHYECYKRKNG